MRRPLNSAALRRDDRLDRTRRLSAWIASGAAAASLGLAGLLGAAIPGHAVTTGKVARQPTARQPSTGRPSTGQPSTGRHRLSAPSSPPSGSTSPPVVSSGGS